MSSGHQRQDALDPELVAYVLDELDPDARERLERRLEGDRALRARLAELSATVGALTELPAQAWDREEPPRLGAPASARIVGAPARVRRPPRLRLAPAVRRLLAPLPAALGIAALAIGVLIGVGVAGSGPAGPAIVATADLLPIDGTRPSASGVFRLASGRIGRLEVSGLQPTDAGHVYELWLMDSTRDLISVATFRVNAAGAAQITAPLPAPPSHFRYLDVSLQPLDGTALHSSQSVLRGRTP
jgi:anti-sigma-K factor RskA